MSQRPSAKREPLDGLHRSRYIKIKDINSGSYGFVQLCQDTRTNEQVAVKFIERGEKVRIAENCASTSTLSHADMVFAILLQPLLTRLTYGVRFADHQIR